MTNRTYKSGESREQVSLLPARVEDYVGQDNPVRAIEAYVRLGALLQAKPVKIRYPLLRSLTIAILAQSLRSIRATV
jgi:hypothetical protein